LAVWDAEEATSASAAFSAAFRGEGGRVAWGTLVYYVEDVKVTAHKMSTPLFPNRLYCWSVRERRGTAVGPWSAYDSAYTANQPFYFKTPKQ
jgi:hypothetical protein